MDAQNVASMEAGLAREGLLPPRPTQPQAIAFVDLAGYTRLTETGGDELAARSAARLAELADEAARPHGGRLVKLLGDGAMLHFRDPRGAVRATWTSWTRSPIGAATRSRRRQRRPTGRPGRRFLRAHGQPGRKALRVATAGVILVTSEVTDAVEEAADGVRFEPVGQVALKNVAAPVEAFRARARG